MHIDTKRSSTQYIGVVVEMGLVSGSYVFSGLCCIFFSLWFGCLLVESIRVYISQPCAFMVYVSSHQGMESIYWPPSMLSPGHELRNPPACLVPATYCLSATFQTNAIGCMRLPLQEPAMLLVSESCQCS